jgi:hypothetical protein
MTSCKDLAASRLAAANPSCVGVRLMSNSREREPACKWEGRVQLPVTNHQARHGENTPYHIVLENS